MIDGENIITHADSVGRRGKTFGAVCLSVCPEHDSKTNVHKVFKLGTGNDLGIYSRSDTFFWVKSSKVKGQGHWVNKYILHTGTAIHRHSLDGATSRLQLRGCLVRASLTFARWRNQSSARDRTL